MALTGRRLCRLDAICAKLKQINHESPPDAKNATNERTPAKEDRYTEVIGEDLSMKCLNNNIIGTVDLHLPTSAEAEDLSVHKDDKKTTVKPDVSTHNQVEETYNKTAESNSSHSQHEQAKPNIDNAHKTINTPSGSSRRKSRKAAAPRNINQVREFYDQYDVDDKDELAEYEANNQNTNFPPDNCDAEEKETDQSGHDSFCGSDSRNGQYSPGGHDSHGCSKDYEETLSNSSHSSHNKAQKDISGHNSETVDLSNRSLDLKHSLGYSSFRDQSHGALDLSVQKDPDHPEDDSPMNGYMSSDDDDFFHPDKNFDKDKQDIKSDSLSSSVSSNESRRESGEQAAHLKDYAESTMNELISMYGFGVAGLSNIAKNVPLTNFSSLAQLPSVSAKLAACMALPSGVQNKLLMNGLAPRVESTEADQKRKGIYANFVQKVQATSTPVKAAEGAPVKPVSDRFTNSAAYINAVFNSQNAQHQESASGATPAGGKHLIPDYSKYLKRYNNGTECGGQHCFDLGYKEHYHCIDCSFHVFIKKEEMVRHYKWHRKREESLQHGFLRFSPLDNCTKRFGMCTHNGRQTHYHCLQNGCDKVYISTSDVQMHANYHRKDSAIMSEGFQRFRATEDCGTQACSFYGHRTTHFHCLRPGCRFTFKNKADMEKHKSYHQKDEVLGRDGFKKFMKYEQCAYSSCRYSKVSNHIHCIRPGCDYVLHSTAQLYSHKRKHERRDFEHAYKQYQDGHHPPTVTSQPSPNLPSLNGNSAIPHMAMLSAGMKRSAEWPDLPEMKRMKVEPTSDMDESSPSSPSGISEGRSTPIDRYTPQSDPPECEENMDTSNNGDVSTDVKTEMFSLSEDKLNNSLNLPIPGQLNSIKEETPSPATENQSTVSGNLYSMSGNQSTVFGNQPALPGNQSANNNNTGIRPISFPSGPMKVGSLPMMNPTLITVPSQALAAATALQPPKSVYTERREKDDSWKVYLVRYTANDPCNPRCLYLYKDHYHCKMEGCLVLFKSKDGVREHARFHELQERITPIAYQTYEQTSNCPDACQYSDKEKHYHCIWTGCTHVVPHIGPTFGRLEHYRVHEMARTAAGKSYSRASSKSTSMSVMDDSSMRRRGRPPKYPKIEMPHIPRVVLSDEEIRQSSQVNVASDGELTSQTKVIKGFRMFTRDDPCPDQECPYITKHHFHCARPRCFTVTDRMDILNLHAKDFHSFVTIMEGFEYFDRTASCRRIHCQHNMTNRHFHCTRKRCDYSFIRHSTMAQHDKKHNSMPVQPLHLTKSDMSVSPSQFIPIVPAISSNSVKSPTIAPIVQPAGTFIPTSILQQFQNISIPLATMMAHQANQIAAISQDQLVMPPVSMAGIPISNVTMGNMAMEISPVQALPATIPATQLMSASTIPNAVSSTETLTSPLITAAGASLAASAINSTNGQGAGPTVPLTVLLQRGANQIPQPSWAEIRSMMHFALTQNCGRPFCKLKKKDHYHCSECNQAFSDPARLRSHIGKHGLRFKRPEHGGNMFRQVDIAPRPSVMIADPACDDMDPDEAQCLAEAGKMVDDDDSDDNDGLKGSSSLTLNPSTFSQMISKAQEENRIASDIGDSDDGMSVSHSSSKSISNDVSGMNLIIDETAGNEAKTDDLNQSGRKIAKTEPEDFMNSNDTNLNNSHQMSSPGSFPVNSPKHISVSKVGSSSNGTVKDAIVSPRTKDDSIPSGYTRWKYNEECCYAKCAYRHSVTHFHCVRADCGYGFSDRSRLVQHTLRHERIDSITGGEMQQFRINQDCKTGGCEYNTRMSHFHCNRCTYNCTDSSKVLTHRKHHAKQDSINSQGFQKYQSIEDCSIPLCPYSRKQNHYHCLIASCKAAVLGPAQMTSHKLKHDTE